MPIGAAARFVHAGIPLLACGILVISVGEYVPAVLAAASFSVNGAPSALQNPRGLSHVGFFARLALAMLWFRRLPSATAAHLFPPGATMVISGSPFERAFVSADPGKSHAEAVL